MIMIMIMSRIMIISMHMITVMIAVTITAIINIITMAMIRRMFITMDTIIVIVNPIVIWFDLVDCRSTRYDTIGMISILGYCDATLWDTDTSGSQRNAHVVV